VVVRQRELLLAFSLVLLGSTCEAPSQRPAIAQPAAPPHARELDPATAAPDPSSPVGRVRDALARGEPEEAMARADAALRDARSMQEAGRLRWLLATAALRLAEAEAAPARTGAGTVPQASSITPEQAHAVARRELEMLAGVQHPLSRWARLRLAELLLDTSPDLAIPIAAPLIDDWAGGDRARMLEALALARAGRHDEAVPKLRALVAETPGHVGAATPGMPLAAILATREDPRDREEALQLYRRVATRAPLATVGEEAARRADEVLATLPPDRRAALATLPVADRLVRAEALFGATRYDRAEQEAADLAAELAREAVPEAAAEPEGRLATRCRARLLQGKAMLRRRERDRGAEHMQSVADDCAEPDVRAWARYHAGKAHAQRNRHERAMEQYAKLEEESPSHRLADDARYRGALSALANGDEPGMLERLRTLAAAYPEGDMRGEARFLVAWRARAAAAEAEAEASPDATAAESAPPTARDHLEAAFAELGASIDEGTGEDAEDIRGRAAYWRARTLADLGRADDAVNAYVELAHRWPLSYYAQQSVARLDELAPERARGLRESWRDADPAPLAFPWRAELDEPWLETALDLLRVGEVDLAERELEHAGALGEGADPDMLWLVASLLDAAGAHPEASLLVRRRLSSFMRTAPTGRARAMWRIAYPRAFHPLIDRTARDEGVPAAFVRAVAREESAFDPNAMSIAHAYGLIQLIEPTARRFARELELPSDPISLRRPEVNVPIGTRFIAFLWRRYEPNPAIVPSAYNAGEGASDRWLRQRPDAPLDVWIEEIPYDETRRYTRRVLQTYGVYSWLDTGELPPLRRELPPRN